MEDPKQLLETAYILSTIKRHDDAVNLLEQCVQKKEEFDKEDQVIFHNILKTYIDEKRNSLQILQGYIQYNQDNNFPERVEKLQHIFESEYEQLQDICQHGIDMIQNTLIPRESDSHFLCNYYKIKADYHRYIAEFASEVDKDRALEDANKAYNQCLEMAYENFEPADPDRLGTILNASVFRFEHLKETEGAIEMLQSTIDEVQPIVDSDDSVHESVQSILSLMHSNLDNWTMNNE